jgi:uncharacterized damage-inducible protein DinB
MDLLDRLLGHDAWTTRQLLLCSQSLSDEELDRDMDMGHRTLRATFLHMIRNVEGWSDLISGQPIRPSQSDQPDQRSVAGMIERLDRAAADLATLARGVAQRGGWDERWPDPRGNPPIERTYGGTILHVITHSMHHRAHVLYMLRRLGVEDLPEGDVLSWEDQLDLSEGS